MIPHLLSALAARPTNIFRHFFVSFAFFPFRFLHPENIPPPFPLWPGAGGEAKSAGYDASKVEEIRALIDNANVGGLIGKGKRSCSNLRR